MQSTKHQKWGKASAKALREQTFQVDGQQLFNSEKRGAGKYLTKILVEPSVPGLNYLKIFLELNNSFSPCPDGPTLGAKFAGVN